MVQTVTLKEAAAFFGVSVPVLRNHLKRNNFECHRSGRKLVLTVEDIQTLRENPPKPGKRGRPKKVSP